MKLCARTGKVRHLDRGSAEKALRDCRKKRGSRMHVYHCPHCKAYHLASNVGAKS